MMTRQEHIDGTWFFIGDGSFQAPMTKGYYSALYGELIGKPCSKYSLFREMGFEIQPTWDELVVKYKPWLESDETMAEHFKPPPPLTDEDRARIQAERDKWPTLRAYDAR